MHVLLLIIAGLVLWPILHRTTGGIKGKVICRNCGTCGRSVMVSPGNFWIEILLWCSGLIPGVIYTLWCSHVAYNACPRCGGRDIVPVDSPVGRKLAEQHSVEEHAVKGGRPPVDATPMSEQLGKR